MIDVYDNLNGSVQLAWLPFTTVIPDSYNVYLNGVLNQNVATRRATVTGLIQASYSRTSVAAGSGNSLRPQSMPPTGVVTPSATYDLKVTAVKTGVEIAVARHVVVTAAPTSVTLTTPMKRDFPFPNVGLD